MLEKEGKAKKGMLPRSSLSTNNGKVSTTLKVSNVVRSEARAPKTDSKSLAENKNLKKGRNKLAKLLAYLKHLVDEKGLPPSKLMVQHAAETSSPSPLAHKPWQEGGSDLKCDKCEQLLNLSRN